MKYLILILFTPMLLFAQGFEFELQPGAFPVTINEWQPYQPWAGGTDCLIPVLIDNDHDGDLDFYFSDNCGYLKYFKNVGSITQPSFQYITNHLDSIQPPGIQTGYWGADIKLVDLNRDNQKDVVIGSYTGMGTSKSLIFFNNGTITQPLYTSLPDTLRDDAGNYIQGRRFTVADIDGDGDYDYFAAEVSEAIKFYENVGDATHYCFHLVTNAWSNINLPFGFSDPTFTDLDGDGDLDLLIGLGDGTIDYYRNDGTVQIPQMNFVTSNYFQINVGEAASPELADIDGDGDLDLFVGKGVDWNSSTQQGDMYYYENIGTPRIPNFVLRTNDYLTFDIGEAAIPRFSDIDADGDPDLFTPIGNRIGFYQNMGSSGNPQFVYETEHFGNITMPWGCIPWFCDVDGDEDYELLIGTGVIPGPPGLYLYLNQGTPQTPNYQFYTNNLLPGVFSQNSALLIPCTADIDADDDQDIFVTDDTGNVYFFRNIGSATHFSFQYETSNWQNLSSMSEAHRYMCFYDIDGDGDLDLFISHQGGGHYLQFYQNVGTPQSASIQLVSEDLFPDLMIGDSAPFLLDIDQDSDGDLFVGDIWGGIRYFKNVTGDTTAVLQPDKVPIPPPSRTILSIGNNPNNPISLISFSLPSPQEVSLSVYNILGSKVTSLVSGQQSAGDHTVSWNAAGNASGVYVVRLTTPGEEVTQKVVILK